jgi:hypothetical protein
MKNDASFRHPLTTEHRDILLVVSRKIKQKYGGKQKMERKSVST